MRANSAEKENRDNFSSPFTNQPGLLCSQAGHLASHARCQRATKASTQGGEGRLRVVGASTGGGGLPGLTPGRDKASGEPEPGRAAWPLKWTSGLSWPWSSLPDSGSETVSDGGVNAVPQQIITDFSLHQGKEGLRARLDWSQVHVDSEQTGA